MSDFIKKVPWGLVMFVVQTILIVVLWLHTISVRAAVVEELKLYATREYVAEREKAHSDWSNEAVKRMDGKMDDMLERIKRIENNQMKGQP